MYEIWRLLWLCNADKTIEKWTKYCIFPFPKKSYLKITKNYRGTNLTAIAAKVYNVLILNCIWLEIEKNHFEKSERFSEKSIYCYILTFDPAPKYYSKVIHRKEVTHSNGQ